jgi:hypothetical protein
VWGTNTPIAGKKGKTKMVVLNDFQVNGLNPSVVSASSSAIQYFPRLLGTSIGVQSVAPSATSALGQLAVPGSSRLNAQKFSVVAAGTLTSGSGAPSETATIVIRANTGTITSPSYTTIATSGAIALNPTVDGVVNNFWISLDLLGDSASGIVGGTQQCVYSGVVEQTTAALTANLSGINFATEPPFGLVVGVTFNSANSGNIAKLYQFQLGQ